jgi:hypothetical protein
MHVYEHPYAYAAWRVSTIEPPTCEGWLEQSNDSPGASSEGGAS